MNEEQLNLLTAKCIKAAAAGYVQQMQTHDFKDDVVATCARYYTDGNQGTIVKRAAKQQAIVNMIGQRLQQIRQARA